MSESRSIALFVGVASICLGARALGTGAGQTPPVIIDDLEDFAHRMERPERAPGPVTLSGPTIDVGRGPLPVVVPSSYDPEVPTPLVMALHGYTNTGAEVEAWMQFAPRAEEYGFLYLYPDGTSDLFGQFWNATDACCNLFGSDVDDSGYLLAVIDEMKSQYNVDPRRVYFVGHSNGGFMSYRMACDHSETVAAIASLAGATFLDPADCAPSGPVHTLQIHGTNDGVIGYGGGCILGNCYPGAVETTEQWAAFNGCDGAGVPTARTFDIAGDVAGNETTEIEWTADCDPGGSSRLWTMNGGSHSPEPLTSEFSRLVVEFFLAHPKPSDCPEDLDASGTVDFGDLLVILGTWGPCPPKGSCPGDLDGSGVVDFGDILLVLGAWGVCA